MYQIYPDLGISWISTAEFSMERQKVAMMFHHLWLKNEIAYRGSFSENGESKKGKMKFTSNIFLIQILCSKILDLQQTQLYRLAGHDMSICIAVWLNELAKLTNNGYPRSGERIHVFLI